MLLTVAPYLDSHYLRTVGRIAARSRPVHDWQLPLLHERLTEACEAHQISPEAAHEIAVAARAAWRAPRRRRAKVLDPIE